MSPCGLFDICVLKQLCCTGNHKYRYPCFNGCLMWENLNLRLSKGCPHVLGGQADLTG